VNLNRSEKGELSSTIGGKLVAKNVTYRCKFDFPTFDFTFSQIKKVSKNIKITTSGMIPLGKGLKAFD